MKNLLLLLLAANILYFLWSWYAVEEPETGVTVLRESDLGPPLTVNPPPAIAESADTVLRKGIPTKLAPTTGPTCVTIGPFEAADAADEAQQVFANAGMKTGMRGQVGEIFVGHWVQIRNVPSREESSRMLSVLKEGGIEEAYPVETEDEGLKISLGVFSSMESAEKVELQANSLGLTPDISPRIRDGQLYFLDVELPPGQGAADIVEEYGEDKVMLRGKANCPSN